MFGAREIPKTAPMAALRGLISRATARDLRVLVVPGPELALAHGLDLAAGGLRLAAGPREANLLLVLPPVSAALLDAATVAYAQMPRPRAIIALGLESISPLPAPDFSAALTPAGLDEALMGLRAQFAAHAFSTEVEDFDAPALQSRIEYTCPMHPEIVSDEPGSCPKCGMFLVPRETDATPAPDSGSMALAAPEASVHSQHMHGEDGADGQAGYTCPMHPEVVSDAPGNCPKCGMNLVSVEKDDDASAGHADHGHSDHEEAAKYTCPMHPEVTSATPGNCPKCGMNLEPIEEGGAASAGHAGHEAVPKYSCPMHPEVTSDAPGSCPKCGMNLVLEESDGDAHAGHADHGHSNHEAAAKYTCPMHPEVVSDEPGNCPKCGMFLVPVESSEETHGGHTQHGGSAHESPTKYTCPMHPEVVSDEPGSCPKCGMFLEALEGVEGNDEAGHQHATHSQPTQDTKPGYTCPMHPEVVSDAPGSCPKCGMNLVPEEATSLAEHGGHSPREDAAGYICPMHPEVTSNEPGSCHKCGMFLVPAKSEDAHHSHNSPDHSCHEMAAKYTCPMHPEVVSDAPGNCPKCGMNLVPEEEKGKSHHGHGAMHDHDGHAHGAPQEDDGIEPGFMSMIEMTEGTPRSSDGLQMEWITVPFGPFFPGLPGGMGLEFTLDGDDVVEAKAHSFVPYNDPLAHGPLAPEDYINRLVAQMPLAPVAYHLLACRAISSAAGGLALEDGKAALARERISSHLRWLFGLGRQTGLSKVERKSAALQLAIRTADPVDIKQLAPALRRLVRQVETTRFLMRRLARAGQGADAAGRLRARLGEILESLTELEMADAITLPDMPEIGQAPGHGHASIKTPRGTASLHVELADGKVVSARLDTPSARDISLVAPLTQKCELGDALVAVAALDLSPWEMHP